MIHADEWMFGWLTGGEIPTVWLQDHLYHPATSSGTTSVASFVYFSHFVTALIVAAVLWLRNRARWASFVRRWFTLTALGLATYFLYPAAPPWWAGAVRPPAAGRARISTRGWDAIGLHGAGNLLNAAQVDAANPVAAMPSLHSAYALLIVVFFLPTVRKRWWPLLLAYPLAMTFTLVYSGEHYMIDVLVGLGVRGCDAGRWSGWLNAAGRRGRKRRDGRAGRGWRRQSGGRPPAGIRERTGSRQATRGARRRRARSCAAPACAASGCSRQRVRRPELRQPLAEQIIWSGCCPHRRPGHHPPACPGYRPPTVACGEVCQAAARPAGTAGSGHENRRATTGEAARRRGEW